ncbi:MAG TPA: hypothetical protein PLA50_11970 [Bacteroidia bacterium]|nr:hypothetical protein [Bacteroidia bacterium]
MNLPAAAFLASLCLCWFAPVPVADAQEPQAPEELAKLRSAYDTEISRVTDPVRKRYLDALQRLQEQYTRSGELDKALVVLGEIERESAEGGKAALTTRTLGGTTWKWGSGGTLKLERGGKAAHSTWGRPGSWKRIDNLSIELQRPGGDPPMKVVFSDETLNNAVVTSHLGTSTTLTRIAE